jgi:hypothetical protein
VTKERFGPAAVLVLSIATPIVIVCSLLPWSWSWSWTDSWELWWSKPGSTASGPVWLAITALVVVIVWTVLVSMARVDLALLVGGAALMGAFLAVLAVVFVMWQHWPETPSTRFAVVLGLALLGLWLVATDWSRGSFLVLGLLLVVGLGVVVAQIGYEQARHEALVAPILRTSEEFDRLRALGDEKAQEAEELAREAADDLAASLRQPLATEPASLRENAQAVATALGAGKPDVVAAAAALAAFDRAYVPTAASSALTAVREQAGAAIEARQVADGLPPDHEALDSALADACRAADERGLEASCSVGSEEVDIELSEALTALDVELARYRAAATGTDQDKDALKDLLGGADETDAGGVTFLDALVRGPEAIVASISRSADEPLVPGPLGWVLLGALALIVWTWLLQHNARQLAGPVEIEKLSGYDPEDKLSEHDAQLRIAVLQNVAEPGAAPGASTINPVTTLLDVAGPDLTLVSRIITAVMSVVGQVHGYTVQADVSEPTKTPPAGNADAQATTGGPAPPATRVLVRVKDLRSKRTLETNLETNDDAATAVTAAGLWAAGYILERSTRIPSWATWNAETASAALATSKLKEPTLAELETAVRTVPNSGLLLYQLGLAYELEKREREAVHVYARAVAAHPRYLLARYRFATALGMMCHYVEDQWTQLAPESRAPVVRAVDLALQRPRIDVGNALKKLSTGTERSGAETAFKKVATTVLEDLEHQVRRLALLAASLRRSDRDLLLPVAHGRRRAGGQPDWLARSARMVYDPDYPDAAKVLAEANRSGSWWQVSYNAACAKAVAGRAHYTEAMELLEQCLVRPGVEQLDAAWVATDPDLEPLAGWPRFRRYCEMLEGGS